MEIEISIQEHKQWMLHPVTMKLKQLFNQNKLAWEDHMLNLTGTGDELSTIYHSSRGAVKAFTEMLEIIEDSEVFANKEEK